MRPKDSCNLICLSKNFLVIINSQGKVCTPAKWSTQTELILVSISMRRLGVLLLTPARDTSWSQGTPPPPSISSNVGHWWLPRTQNQNHRKVTPHPFHGNSPVPIFTPGWMGIMRVNCFAQDHNTMARPGLESRPLNPESSALIIRLPRLPYFPNCVRNHIITFPHPTFINNHVGGLYHPTFFSNSNLPTKIISVVKSYGNILWGNSLWANLRSSPHGRQNDTVPIWRPALIGQG